jgi:hypothetical protein
MPDRDYAEIFRMKQSMSGQISSKIDHDYALYAGASLDDGLTMSFVDVCLRNKLINERLTPLVKLYRVYLDQRRKAYFVTERADIISLLGFILGVKDEHIRGSIEE